MDTLSLRCHRTIDRFPTAIGVSTTCAAQGQDQDLVVNGVHTVTVCAREGAPASDLASLGLLYVGSDTSSGCGDVVDSFTYLAVALPSSSSPLGSGLPLAQYVHSALASGCGGPFQPCPWVTAGLLGKYLLSTSVVSDPRTLALALAPSNALPSLGTASAPLIQLTGAGYVVTDRDVHETRTSGQEFFSNVAVSLAVSSVEPGGAARTLEAPPTGAVRVWVWATRGVVGA